MASLNRVSLIGNLGRDPETRTFPSGDQLTNATLATTEKWKDKTSGETKEATEWHRLVFNGALAKIAADYLRKGSSIYVEGSIKTRKYQDKDGVEKYATDIRVTQMQMLGPKADAGGGGGGQQQQRTSAPQQRQQTTQGGGGGGGFDMDDDIPFARHEHRTPF